MYIGREQSGWQYPFYPTIDKRSVFEVQTTLRTFGWTQRVPTVTYEWSPSGMSTKFCDVINEWSPSALPDWHVRRKSCWYREERHVCPPSCGARFWRRRPSSGRVENFWSLTTFLQTLNVDKPRWLSMWRFEVNLTIGNLEIWKFKILNLVVESGGTF